MSVSRKMGKRTAHSGQGSRPSAAAESMDDVGRRFQAFYGDVEELLVKRRWKGRSSFPRGLHFQQQRHASAGSVSSSAENTDADEKEGAGVKEEDDTEKESEAEEHPHPEDERSRRIRDVVEAVERTLCNVFYDR